MAEDRWCGLCGQSEQILMKTEEIADFDFCKSCFHKVMRQYRNSVLINSSSGYLTIPTSTQTPTLPPIAPAPPSLSPNQKPAKAQHSFTLSAELRKIEQRAKRPIDCEEHLGKVATYYCDKISCRKFVCNICVNDLGAHYQHPAVIIPQYIQYSRIHLKTLMQFLESNEETAKFILKKLAQNYKIRWNQTYQEMQIELTEVARRAAEVREKLSELPSEFRDNDVSAILILQLVLRLFSRPLAFIKDTMTYIVPAYQRHYYE